MIRSVLAIGFLSLLFTTPSDATIIDPDTFNQKSPRKLCEESIRKLAGYSPNVGVAVGPSLLRIAIIDGRGPTKVFDGKPTLPSLDFATSKQCNVELTKSNATVNGVIEAIRALTPMKTGGGSQPSAEPQTNQQVIHSIEPRNGQLPNGSDQDDDATLAYKDAVKHCSTEWKEVKDYFSGANARPNARPLAR